MAEENESVSETSEVSLRDHLDNPLLVLVVIAIFVYAVGALGRWAGNSMHAPGVASFFGA
ncbi:MAG: hypothetical protein ACREHG_03770 [Candidatus Saccharimonadales bacterium]